MLFPFLLLLLAILAPSCGRRSSHWRPTILSTMKIPFTKCHVLLYTHRPNASEVSSSISPDIDMDHVFIRAMSRASIPVSYVTADFEADTEIASWQSSVLGPDLRRCVTFVTFAKPTVPGGHMTSDKLMKYARRPWQTESDYAILGINSLDSSFRIGTIGYTNQQPENMVVFQYSSASKPLELPPTDSLLAVHIFCEMYPMCSLTYRIGHLPKKFWSAEQTFHAFFFPRSSYRTSHSYNWNQHKLRIDTFDNPFATEAMHRTFEARRYLTYRTLEHGIVHATGTLLATIGSSPWGVPFNVYISAQLAEIYNASLAVAAKDDHLRTYPGISLMTGTQTEGLDYLHFERYHYTGKSALGLICFNSKSENVDASQAFAIFDLWTWISILVTLFLLVWWLFQRNRKSAIYDATAIMVGQGVEIEPAWRFTLGSWLAVSFVITNTFLTHYESMLVVPPHPQPLRTFEQVYNEGYRFVEPKDSDNIEMLSRWIDRFSDTYYYYAKLRKNVIRNDSPYSSLSFIDFLVTGGPHCYQVRNDYLAEFTANFRLCFGDKVQIRVLEDQVFLYLRVMAVRQPNAGVTYGGLTNLNAAGILKFWFDRLQRVRQFEVDFMFEHKFREKNVYFSRSVSRLNLVGFGGFHDYTITLGNSQCFIFVYLYIGMVTACFIAFVIEWFKKKRPIRNQV